eukprot:GFKZ01009671.1.p2 GENE.GFKZ01009671.1~~GFKZ01009671.1.p2  ORF type:complete len:111 (+),score=1.44 GFKZ01009671.1:460-792(+)
MIYFSPSLAEAFDSGMRRVSEGSHSFMPFDCEQLAQLPLLFGDLELTSTALLADIYMSCRFSALAFLSYSGPPFGYTVPLVLRYPTSTPAPHSHSWTSASPRSCSSFNPT